MVVNNKLIIQYGQGTYPQVPKDTPTIRSVILPTTFSTTNYSVGISILTDGLSTAYLRQRCMTRTVSQMNVDWYTPVVRTQRPGLFMYICVGY